MKLREILQETKKKTDVKWIAKLKDGKTKTIWAPTKYDAKQKLGTSILIQGGYTIKKALNENRNDDAINARKEKVKKLDSVVTKFSKHLEMGERKVLADYKKYLTFKGTGKGDAKFSVSRSIADEAETILKYFGRLV